MCTKVLLNSFLGWQFAPQERIINFMSKSIKSSSELGMISGYRLEYEEYLPDVSGCGLVFRHIKSGARICVISNDDKNKTFYIGFRTPVENDTGVPHIIEHTVLCGSEKYPSRDPFMLLAKGSLNTFLNAMTYPDKTVYPVASCNDHDFKNLMSVYLDAVFHPNIYKYKEIFMQEGWHYELESREDELKINGIVYNEMKGVLSSPDSSLFDELCKVMYPDTSYGKNSGGDPEHIPELTYEDYLDFHRTHYHPSNSYIFLWGDVDIEERLTWIDENYLSQYSAIDVSSTDVESQKPFGQLREATAHYSVENDDKKDGRDERTYLAFAASTCSVLDAEECIAWDIIADALINTPGAPIRRALTDAGIGQDIYGGILDHLRQSGFYVMAKNACSEDKKRFYEIVIDGLKKASHGIDRKALEASINSREFSYREADYGSTPRGLCCGLDMLQSWLYDDSAAFTYMHGGEIYKELRSRLGTDYFEELIKKRILNSHHSVLLSYEPVPGLIDEINGKLSRKLADYKKSLTDEQLNRIVDDTKALHEYQSAPSTKEEQNCIPCLTRDELEPDAIPLSNIETELGGVKTVLHEGSVNGISYVTLYFDINDLSDKWLPYLGELGDLLGRMDTENYSYNDLSNEVKLNVGRMNFAPVTVLKNGTADESKLYFTVSVSCFEGKVEKSLELAAEILSSTKFTNLKRLRELIAESRSDVQSKINNRGNTIAVGRLLSYFSRHALKNEWLGGISFYSFINKVLDGYDENSEKIAEGFSELCRLIFKKSRMFASVCSGEKGIEVLRAALPEFSEKLFSESSSKCDKSSESEGVYFDGSSVDMTNPVKLNEGFMLSSQVQFVGMGGNLKKAGYEYSGTLKVLENILNCEYLYNSVRVLGGAYGCNCRFAGSSGNVYFASFRDPHLKNTESVYRNAGEFIRSLDPDDKSLTRYIIGTFSGLDRPLSFRDRAARSMTAYLSGVSYEELCRERREIIETTAQQLRDTADMIEAVLSQDFRCTLGNAKKLRENAEDFENLIPLS